MREGNNCQEVETLALIAVSVTDLSQCNFGEWYCGLWVVIVFVLLLYGRIFLAAHRQPPRTPDLQDEVHPQLILLASYNMWHLNRA